MRIRLFGICLFLFVFSLFSGCGIDEYAYIVPVFSDDISNPGDNTVTVRTKTDHGTAFTHFMIMYRIYLSDVQYLNPIPSEFSRINTALASHYNSINAYNPTSERLFSESLMDSLFRNRGYKQLRVEGEDMQKILGSENGILGRELFFNFGSHGEGRRPTMTIRGGGYTADYNLLRSSEIVLQDDHYFLYSGNMVASYINIDVEANSNGSGYAYAAMFIIAIGLDELNYSNIYSNPTLIHAFPIPLRGISG